MQRDAWTGGQYSLYRLLLGAFVTCHCAALVPWAADLFAVGGTIAWGDASPLFGVLPNPLQVSDAPSTVVGLVCIGAFAGLLLALGWCDRAAALLSAAVLAWLFARNPLIANPSLPLLGWLLLAHACVPSRPFGSLAAACRGVATDWRLPVAVWRAAWVVLAISYSYSGWTKLASPAWLSGDAVGLVLQNPLARDHLLREIVLGMPDIALQALTWIILAVELLFAPFALLPRLRPWLWSAMLIAQIGFLVFLDFADLTLPMLLAHLLTFDPRWLRSVPAPGPAVLLYDADSPACRAFVRFALREDRDAQLRFAPRHGRSARLLRVSDAARMLVLVGTRQARDGDAAIEVLQRLGGLWRLLGDALAMLPRRASDALVRVLTWHGDRVRGEVASLSPTQQARMLD